MALTQDDVRRIALLARLELTAEEEHALGGQLDHILGYFEKLMTLQTEGVEPMAQVFGLESAYREDVVTNPPAPAELRANAPSRDETLFKVPKIIE